MDRGVQNRGTDQGAAVLSDSEAVAQDILIDDAVREAMPKGSIIVSAKQYGKSAWAQSARVSVVLPDGRPMEYFLKYADSERAESMMRGEFTSMNLISSLMPALVPKPHAWGKYKGGNPPSFFFLSDFVNMHLEPPLPDRFTSQLAQLHKKSKSPNRMFGFSVTTFDGQNPHIVAWQKSWADFFAQLMNGVLELDREANGKWPDLERASKQLGVEVIPKMLGSLKYDGESIAPCLIHGDCYEGNVGTVSGTGEVVLFDAGAYYAHNEMEMGIWRAQFCQMFAEEKFVRAYWNWYGPAEPVEQWGDRNRLYSLKYNLNYSAGHPGSVTRET